jgi:Tfp pilus assembly protein PilF
MNKLIFIILALSLVLSSCGIFVKKHPPLGPEELAVLGENHVTSGIEFFDIKDYSAAISEWKTALKYIPDDAEVYNFMGIAYHRLGKLDSSIYSYERATEIDPAYYQVLNNTGYIYFLKGDYNSALKYFQMALKIEPEYEQAKINKEKCIEIMEGKLPIAAFELFEQAESLDSLRLKINSYQKALQLDSNYVDSWNNLGVAYHYYGYIDSATYCLNKALSINPEHPQVNNNVAFLLDATSKYEAAVYYYQKAIKYKPDYTVAMENLGDTYTHLNDFKSAEAIWEAALKIDPNNLAIKQKIDKLETIRSERGG